MSFPRKGPSRSEHIRSDRRLFCKPDVLEARRVLQAGIPAYQSPWIPSDLLVTNPITKERESLLPGTRSTRTTTPARGSTTPGRLSRAPIGRATSG